MKKLFLFSLSLILLVSCEKSGSEKFSTTLGGDTDLPMNEVGTTFYNTTMINGERFTTNGQVEVVANEGGITTIHINTKIPEFLVPFIPEDLKDANGNFDTEVRLKNSTEGVLDYTNLDKDPFVVAKYDAKVGDEYILKKSDGKSIVREVTKHSTTDDFEWVGGQWLYLKTVTVEQDDLGIPGVDKAVINANHKYGIVGLEIIMEDGTSIKIFLNSSSY